MGIKRGKIIKGSVVALVLLLLLSTVGTTFAAQRFTDVPENHWAKEYIEKVHELGIIEGDEDFATFKPNEKVAYFDGIVMIAKLLEVDEELANKVTQINKDFLEEMNILEKHKKGIAIAISAGIVSEDAIRLAVKEEKLENITKVDVCIFLTRSMNLEQIAKNKELVVLPFKDFDLIPEKATSYIEVMLEQGIISKKGDAEGKFNPESSVNRAVMSKMLSMAYDYIQENKIEIDIEEENEDINVDEDDGKLDNNETEVEETDDKNQESNEEEKVETFKITGVITGTLKTKNIINIKIKKDNGEEELYQANSEAEAKVDGEEINILDVKEGTVVEAVVTEENVILELDATSYENQYTGTVASVSNVLGPVITIKTEIDGEVKKKIFYGTENLIVLLDGKEVELMDLNEDDAVDLKTKDGGVVKIIAQSKNREFEGTLFKVDFDESPVIEIQGQDGNMMEFKLSEDTKIFRNSSLKHFIDLKTGDYITVYTKYDNITEVEARTVNTEISGILSSILIANTSKLTITNESGKEETYIISNDSNVKVEGKYKSIYDLRLGHKVNLLLEGNVIVDLNAEKVVQESRYIGDLIYINKESQVIMVKTEDGQNKLINTTNATSFMDVDGSVRDIGSLDIGDELLIVCRYDGVTFIAKNIVIMEKGQK